MTTRIQQLEQQLTMATPTDITLYTAATPNGIKISIALAELNLDYKVCLPSPTPLIVDPAAGCVKLTRAHKTFSSTPSR